MEKHKFWFVYLFILRTEVAYTMFGQRQIKFAGWELALRIIAVEKQTNNHKSSNHVNHEISKFKRKKLGFIFYDGK